MTVTATRKIPIGSHLVTDAPGLIKEGESGPAVTELQRALNGAGAKLKVDGDFGAKTEVAVRNFQRDAKIKVDGIVGPETLGALKAAATKKAQSRDASEADASWHGKDGLFRGMPKNDRVKKMEQALGQRGLLAKNEIDGVYDAQTSAAVKKFKKRHEDQLGSTNGDFAHQPVLKILFGTNGLVDSRANGTATITRVEDRAGLSDMARGSITVNGHTYRFNSGGGGRGYLPPGRYTVHGESTPGRTMIVDGVGYSFNLTNHFDRRVGDTRTLLRIHPDGLGEGTIGCIGIVGNGDVQRRFERDMRAELKRHGGSYSLTVKDGR